MLAIRHPLSPIYRARIGTVFFTIPPIAARTPPARWNMTINRLAHVINPKLPIWSVEIVVLAA